MKGHRVLRGWSMIEVGKIVGSVVQIEEIVRNEVAAHTSNTLALVAVGSIHVSYPHSTVEPYQVHLVAYQQVSHTSSNSLTPPSQCLNIKHYTLRFLLFLNCRFRLSITLFLPLWFSLDLFL